MALRFYGDESEDKDGKVFGMGGFIGRAEEWEALQEDWIARIKPTGIKAYHMIDCECGYGEFSGWPKPQREELTKDLIGLILKRELFMLGFTVMLDDYRSLAPLDVARVRLGKDEWHLMFQGMCMCAAEQAVPFPKEESVVFFFDWKEKKGDAFTLIDEFRNDDRLGEWRHRLGTLTFGHKEIGVADSIPLLQAADIAAVECRKFVGNPITRPDLPHPRRSFMAFHEAGRILSIKVLEKTIMEEMYADKCRELGIGV